MTVPSWTETSASLEQEGREASLPLMGIELQTADTNIHYHELSSLAAAGGQNCSLTGSMADSSAKVCWVKPDTAVLNIGWVKSDAAVLNVCWVKSDAAVLNVDSINSDAAVLNVE